MYERVVDSDPQTTLPLDRMQLPLNKFASFNRALLETKGYPAFGDFQIALVIQSRM